MRKISTSDLLLVIITLISIISLFTIIKGINENLPELESEEVIEYDFPDNTVDISVYQPKQCTPIKYENGDFLYVTKDGNWFSESNPFKLRWCAVSHDLQDKGYNFGDTIEVVGTWMYDGKWIIRDLCNERIVNRFDLLIDNEMYVDLFTDVLIYKSK